MSASREKKQRQGAGPSEKALQAQQQQAARKRQTITYTIIGVVIAALVAALLIWNSGFFQARATAATVGDTKLTTAELSYYYYSARQTYAMYGSYLGFDTSTPDDEQIYNAENNQTYRDYFLESALQNARQDAALAAEAVKSGHTTADVRDSLDANIDSMKAAATTYGYSYSAYLKAMYGPYMSASAFEKVYTQALLASLAYNEKGTELSDSYSQDDLQAYYEADDHADTLDTFEYSFLYFTPADVETKDSEGNDLDEDTVNTNKELALAEAKSNAEEALDALKDGGKISTLATKYDLADANFGEHLSSVGASAAAAVLKEKLLTMKEGDTELVENGESGCYVVVLDSRRLVDDPTKDVRHILARAENTTDDSGKLVAPTDEAWAAAKAKMDEIEAAWNAGEKTEDAFAALANEKSDDGDGTTGGLYTKIDVNDSYVPEFMDWIFADGRAVGDTGVVQHSADEGSTSGYYGYHLIYMVGDNEPLWMRSARSALASEARTAWVEELEGGFEAALTDGANNLGK